MFFAVALLLMSTCFFSASAAEQPYFNNHIIIDKNEAYSGNVPTAEPDNNGEAVKDETIEEAVAAEDEAVEDNADDIGTSENEANEESELQNISFSDISEDDWFYENVIDLAERGIISGYPDGSFKPDGTITFAEYTKLLVQCVESEIDYITNVLDYSHWADRYIYAAVEGKYLPIVDILTTEYLPDAYITRSYMAKMMVLALDIASTAKETPFADSNDRYMVEAYTEYLMFGEMNEQGTRFSNGDVTATRAEAAAFISRILSYIEDKDAYKAAAVLENAANTNLSLEYEFIDFFYYANKQMLDRYSFTTNVPFDIWCDYFTRTQIMYPDALVGRMYECEFLPADNRYIITVEYDNGYETARKNQLESRRIAKEIVDKIITPEMTVVDKIVAIHNYIVENCSYDYENYIEGKLEGDVLNAYGVFVEGRAVCQGYCAAFNMLCEYAGIKSIAVNGKSAQNDLDHLWNAVIVNDEIFYIDTTFDDPIPDQPGVPSRDFLYVTESALRRYGHEWDSAGIKKIYFE